MKIKPRLETDWQKTVAANFDPYGIAVVQYTQRWVELMEEQISAGMSVAEIAKETSHKADTEGITGFMYGCAVSILSQVWEHGEELRQWHNLDTQIGHEGENANKDHGVLNLALLNIGKVEANDHKEKG